MSTQSSDQRSLAPVYDSDGWNASESGDQADQQGKHWNTRGEIVPLHRAMPLQALKRSAASQRKPRASSPKRSCSFRVATEWLARDWWPWEVLCWILSLVFFGAVAVVLTVFDNRPLPEWPLGITPNALVSVFATIQSSLLAIPVSAGMGQLKGTWFRRPQKLDMFETIEGAGRDPIAAVTLLLRRSGGQVTSTRSSTLPYDV